MKSGVRRLFSLAHMRRFHQSKGDEERSATRLRGISV